MFYGSLFALDREITDAVLDAPCCSAWDVEKEPTREGERAIGHRPRNVAGIRSGVSQSAGVLGSCANEAAVAQEFDRCDVMATSAAFRELRAKT